MKTFVNDVKIIPVAKPKIPNFSMGSSQLPNKMAANDGQIKLTVMSIDTFSL